MSDFLIATCVVLPSAYKLSPLTDHCLSELYKPAIDVRVSDTPYALQTGIQITVCGATLTTPCRANTYHPQSSKSPIRRPQPSPSAAEQCAVPARGLRDSHLTPCLVASPDVHRLAARSACEHRGRGAMHSCSTNFRVDVINTGRDPARSSVQEARHAAGRA